MREYVKLFDEKVIAEAVAALTHLDFILPEIEAERFIADAKKESGVINAMITLRKPAKVVVVSVEFPDYRTKEKKWRRLVQSARELGGHLRSVHEQRARQD